MKLVGYLDESAVTFSIDCRIDLEVIVVLLDFGHARKMILFRYIFYQNRSEFTALSIVSNRIDVL